MLAGGQTLCSFSDIRKLDGKHNDEFSHFMHVTVSFGNVGGSTPAARVICSRALPLDCVTSVVEFRTGTLVATKITTNTVVTKTI